MNGVAVAGRSGLVSLALAVLLFAAVVTLFLNLANVERFIALLRGVQLRWLLAAVVLQGFTYFCAAAVWQRGLQRQGVGLSLRALVPLSVAKLFAEQALPSGGASGTAFLFTALRRRGVPAAVCAVTLVNGLISYYAAYLLLALLSVLLLAYHHEAAPWMIGLALVFALLAIAIPGGAAWVLRYGTNHLPRLLARRRGIGEWLRQISAPHGSRRLSLPLLAWSSGAQLLLFILDAMTLWVALRSLGESTSLLTVLPALMIASMVTTVGPVPVGVGTFEATCTLTLHLLGIELEEAQAGTLLLRGLTVWVPMLPGLWIARRELRRQ